MPQFRFAPPVDKLGDIGLQSVELLDGRNAIARAAWQPIPSVPGAYQLLWAEVAEPHRRSGRGSLLIAEVVRQAQLHGKSRGVPIRRMMTLVPQPNVIARAWLARNGFLHVKTMDDLAPGEILIMLRTFS